MAELDSDGIERQMMGRWGDSRSRADHGASAVEFAIVLPLLLLVLMLAITGSLAYNRKVTLTHAARETARWGSTLNASLAADGSIDNAWFNDIVARAEGTSQGELRDDSSGRYVCVAYVEDGTFDHDDDGTTAPVDRTWRRVEDGSSVTKDDGVACFEDGITSGEPRVQVRVGRDARLDAVLLRREVELRSEAVARYEHESPYEEEASS